MEIDLNEEEIEFISINEMEMKIADTRPEKQCKFCDESMRDCIQCHASSWRFLNDNECCHFECYVHHCVEISLKDLCDGK